MPPMQTSESPQTAPIIETYFVLDSPLEAENGKFACPDQGCDGFTFDSADQAAQHHNDWHSGPYTCVSCDFNFAARPALERHLKASRHGTDTLHLEREIERMELIISAQDFQHASSPQTRKDHAKQYTDQIFLVTPKTSKFIDSIRQGAKTVNDAVYDFVCPEKCCPRFGTDFLRLSEFRRHTNTDAHRCAVLVGSKLRQLEVPSENCREAEYKAIRALKCDASQCFEFGKTFASFRGYIQHISTLAHRRRHAIDLGDISDILEKHDDDEIMGELKCTREGCPMNGKTFKGRYNFKQHLNSAAHQATTETYGIQRLKLTPSSKPNPQLLSPISPIEFSPFRPPPSPSGPLARRRPRTPRETVSTRASGSAQRPDQSIIQSRMAALELDNKNLREEIENFKKEMKNLGRELEIQKNKDYGYLPDRLLESVNVADDSSTRTP